MRQICLFFLVMSLSVLLNCKLNHHEEAGVTSVSTSFPTLNLQDSNAFIRFHSFQGDIETFIKNNQVGGGFLTFNDRLFFLSSKPLNDKYNDDMLADLQVPKRPFKLINSSELAGWIAFDVSDTSVIPKPIFDLVGRSALYDGFRCYSAVMFALGMTKGVSPIFSSFFVDWAKSSVVIGSKDKSVLGKQVVIALDVKGFDKIDKTKVPVEHVAYMLTDKIVFQKASPMFESPFELVPIESFENRYPASEFEFRYYKPSLSFDGIYKKWSGRITPEMKDWMTYLDINEPKIGEFLFDQKLNHAFPDDLEESQYQEWLKSSHLFVSTLKNWSLDHLQVAKDNKMAQLQRLTDVEEKEHFEFLWNVLINRIDSGSMCPDPMME